MKTLRSLLAELSSNWLRRRKVQAPVAGNPVKPVSRLPHQTAKMRPAHKPKPPSSRDVASNM
ncbi:MULTISPECIES: hypothetical protein [unclassified Mesorhizobium]|uniref:hypothetical protein n=1 Tax=unclassified Mesorhizobium TaxID=325217 RepID=UPI000FCCAB02|nr:MULTISPECIES: hypothetical protein [unclassified Mesorhizobium]RUW52112.1 hypothetical protein EOA36_13065 [Mesorhizobium sp. M8A.F.Ca.ET.021.01.1.1]RWC86629.1 MAG: hypothetical protein EOS72_25260 [Mesorhizobium sp.]TGP90015.1 hypothetical protein EN861_24835 [Mesorhizobium sp. M8A.F.Ca.ET.218.01.1.1]TGS48419.1 hypothetical protein EN825_05685 [Mesorhizobium sp. M8A.F.Ca.ET.182.01.1.1]TGS83290.1 hypothetical protein EN824_02445 [Mesorhizobium sp. M8A.F.Ca.ET.181.01.1.1]